MVFDVGCITHGVVFVVIFWTLGMTVTLELGMNAEAGVFTFVIVFISTRDAARSRDFTGECAEVRIFMFCQNIGWWCPG